MFAHMLHKSYACDASPYRCQIQRLVNEVKYLVIHMLVIIEGIEGKSETDIS